MSKCDISIQFDQPDRSFQGGSSVSGQVVITVNEDIRCKKITLMHYWKIHGRGNTHTDKKPAEILSEGTMLTAGERLELPFEFEVDRWPVTHHGHYINVDHYIKVGVDVPWAFDPKLEQDFVVLPGKRPSELPEGRGELADLSKGAGQLTGATKYIVYGLLGVFAIMFSVMLVFLIPVFLIGGLAFWFWRKAVHGRVGDVELTVPHVIVTPGEAWRVRLQFTPRKSFAINGVSLQLTAVEAATSGSGTNATTYTHKVFEEVYQILPAGRLDANVLIDEEVAVSLPSKPIYSLEKPSNRITWEAVARIDIPRFPDWKKKTKLQMLPAEFYDEAAIAEVQDRRSHEPYTASQRSEDPFSSMSANEAMPVSGDSGDHTTMESAGSNVDLMPVLQLLDQISEAERYGNERTQIANAAGDRAFDTSVVIERVISTIDPTGNDARFLGGKTILGRLSGTDHEVELFTVVGSNDLLDGLGRGDQWQTLATVTEWDSLHNRLVMHEVPFDA